MRFVIITHAEHKMKGHNIYAYEPYVKEMNLWLKYVDEVKIVAPVSNDVISSIESKYQFKKNHCVQGEAISSKEQITTSQPPRNDDSVEKEKMLKQVQHEEEERHCEQGEAISSKEQITTSPTPRNDIINLIPIPSFDITSIKNAIQAIFKIPKICVQIYKAMQWADHIHLRCPGNIGFLGSLIQILFPKKPITVKYAGNWDSKSKQPLSYRLQKWLISNTFLTRNCKVLVYGKWPNQSKNIVPFFTASYSENEIRHSEQSEAISSKEQIATSHTPRNDETERHPEFISGSHDKEQKMNSIRQAQTDNEKELTENNNEQIASSHTPRNDESKERITLSHPPRNDEKERHSEQGEVISLKKQTATFQAPCNNVIELIKIHTFDITSLKNAIQAVFKIPKICIQIYKAMKWADHIHLRCPGNIGLLGSLVQIFFSKKPKTIKYAGNWDPKSKQPWSYKLQKWILSNTFLTKNAKVLVYGNWPNQSKNIVPFFTASYSKNEVRHSEQSEAISTEKQLLDNKKLIKFLFIGNLTPGKNPLLSVKIIHKLLLNNYKVKLDIYGDGLERQSIEAYILNNQLQNNVILHGNVSKENIKLAYQNAHFLLFISKSEGWPKVVAEAMFWGCLPIASSVSCIPEMLGNGARGKVVSFNESKILNDVVELINHSEEYNKKVQSAMKWSRQFTLEKFESELKKLI